jgi:hypothetical protein
VLFPIGAGDRVHLIGAIALGCKGDTTPRALRIRVRVLVYLTLLFFQWQLVKGTAETRYVLRVDQKMIVCVSKYYPVFARIPLLPNYVANKIRAPKDFVTQHLKIVSLGIVNRDPQ